MGMDQGGFRKVQGEIAHKTDEKMYLNSETLEINQKNGVRGSLKGRTPPEYVKNCVYVIDISLEK